MRDIVKQGYQRVDDAHLATTSDDQTSQRRGMRTARLLLRQGHAEDYRVHGHRRSCRPKRHLVPSSSTPRTSGCFPLSSVHGAWRDGRLGKNNTHAWGLQCSTWSALQGAGRNETRRGRWGARRCWANRRPTQWRAQACRERR